VSRAESVRAFRILPNDFTQEGGELTPKLSIKRNVVLERRAADIERLYAESKKDAAAAH
jgi:long-chain acyl-CoA synthetase